MNVVVFIKSPLASSGRIVLAPGEHLHDSEVRAAAAELICLNERSLPRLSIVVNDLPEHQALQSDPGDEECNGNTM
jgi:hypothetical protein